ncbi:50S ribosomal protein L3 [Enterobacteriaceae bacterium ET-AT1-13]|nr:50S ribosomal protein L3 [Enterobacteriaceae bacterium ET-AT1-13]WGS66329.1 50S ribosomal protein L3 [Enterobacteriaceae bacterium Cmel17]WMC17352.1 MAG: 50S ribosomal protein L3 [Enterobacteriaceae bacterium Cmel21]WMC17558.1 MAG: 50S ribosomal protein L3 [Enterobacteriaceae bacterium PSmelAO3-2]WMC17763.1 MAG: 50S ribosomal protein L3 [Enterobacteriaceae bacterium PSmelAO3-1]WMC17966.1 MAG: 50S ribosomal protein L3 [Enterobacteriaceae bacterium PSmelAO1]
MIGLVGKKIGMSRVFKKNGFSIPISIVEIKNNYITQIKNIKKNNYFTIQITTGYKKKYNKSEKGHFKKSGLIPGEGLWEFRVFKKKKFNLGEKIDLNIFSENQFIDITGISKGKGFSGTVKRWNFNTQDSTHGNSLSHRVPGSIGQNQTPGKVFKGKKMAGHLGNQRVTVQNLKIIKIDIIKKLLLIKGSIPGSIGKNIIIKPAIKKNGV